jgi:hypothetical protein
MSNSQEIVATAGFDSRDCIDIIIDVPGDSTVRPIRPALLPYTLAERKKLARWLPPPLNQPYLSENDASDKSNGADV